MRDTIPHPSLLRANVWATTHFVPGRNDTHGSVDTKQKFSEKLLSKDLTFFKSWCIIKVQKEKGIDKND